MELEIGKKYVDGNGDIVTIIEHYETLSRFPYKGGNERWYEKNGVWSLRGGPHHLNLVSEYNSITPSPTAENP